jgi:hypothetical protein
VVDTFVRYRITNPLEFYKTLRFEGAVPSRLGPIVESAVKALFVTLEAVAFILMLVAVNRQLSAQTPMS